MTDLQANTVCHRPFAIANSDVTLHKTNRLSLAREFETRFASSKVFSHPSVTVIGGLGIFRS